MAKYVYPGRDNLQAMSGADHYNKRLCDIVRRSARGNESKGKILDFGAGMGTYARLLRERGLAVDCLEPDEQYARSLREAGFWVCEDLASLRETYEVIYAMNVLEHIEDDKEVFAALAGRLNPGGRMIVHVPAFKILFSSMDRVVGHHRRYRAGELRQYSAQFGLTIRTCRYCDPLGFFASLLFRLAGDESGVISARSVKVYDRTAFRIGTVLEPLTGRLFGKNVLLVAVRDEH